MGRELASFLNWLRSSEYSAPEDRELTAMASHQLHQNIRSWGMGIKDRGLSIYRHRKRGEDGDRMFADFIREGHEELTRVVALARFEASKGNRDLDGTGLNPRPSEYNN